MTDPGGERIERLLAERTEDLQRLQAEFANYRKRVHRDRLAVGEAAVANVLTGLLPVLDALDAARTQGRLTGGFRAVAELLESRLGSLGLESFGEVGDTFDPSLHDALARIPAATGTIGSTTATTGSTGAIDTTGTTGGISRDSDTDTATGTPIGTGPGTATGTDAATSAGIGAVSPVCAEILRAGYRVGDHLLRPAEVVVSQAVRAPAQPDG